jgi:hypothetical protein
LPVRQGLLSFPIPLRLLFAIYPQWLAPVLQIVHRVISTFLIKQRVLKCTEAQSGAVTLIQRFGGGQLPHPVTVASGLAQLSAANLNIHLHCLVLDGVYRTTEGLPVFHAVRAPTATGVQVYSTGS